jgi:hypothetical protein
MKLRIYITYTDIVREKLSFEKYRGVFLEIGQDLLEVTLCLCPVTLLGTLLDRDNNLHPVFANP